MRTRDDSHASSSSSSSSPTMASRGNVHVARVSRLVRRIVASAGACAAVPTPPVARAHRTYSSPSIHAVSTRTAPTSRRSRARASPPSHRPTARPSSNSSTYAAPSTTHASRARRHDAMRDIAPRDASVARGALLALPMRARACV